MLAFWVGKLLSLLTESLRLSGKTTHILTTWQSWWARLWGFTESNKTNSWVLGSPGCSFLGAPSFEDPKSGYPQNTSSKCLYKSFFLMDIWGDLLSHTIFLLQSEKMGFSILQKDPYMNFYWYNFWIFKNLGLVDLGFEVSESQKISLKGLRTLPILGKT